MPFNWRIPLLLSIALLLAASGIFTPTAEAQTNGLVPKGDAGLDSSSQASPDAHRRTFLSWYEVSGINGRLGDQVNLEGSLNFDVSEFGPITGGSLEDSYLQLVNLGEGAYQRNDSSTHALAPLLVASAPSQVLSKLFADSNSPRVPDAGLPLPNPPNPSDQGWHFSISPYLWLPGLHGTLGALGHDASVHASFSDIFSNFSFALMGAFDPRYNRIVMPLDFMWIRLTNDKASPFDILATSAKVKVNLDVLTQKIGYRVVDAEKFKVDALAGVRYWHAGTTLDLVSSVLPKTNFYSSADWVDAIGGARIQVMLSPKLVLTIAGDAGGGGANSDYQVAGLIGWKLKKMILQAGYRYLTVNYRPGSTICDVTISGLILGATIPLK
jgi:hypothetical protein